MKKVIDSIKNFFKKIDFNAVKEFFVKYWRYFAAVLVFVLMLVVLVNCTGPDKRRSAVLDTQEPSAENFVLDDVFEQDAYEAVDNLIINYFNAFANGDIAALETLAHPITDNEKSYITVCSQYFESYQNVSCYTKSGLTEGSYLVSTYYELKFYGVETVAPGLEFFYIETDANGNLYINNRYCAYNRERMEQEMDPDIYSIYVLFGQQDDVTALRQNVQAQYEEAMNSDVNLVAMLSTTFPAAINDWKQMVAMQVAAEEGSTQDGEPSVDGEDAAAQNPDDTPADGQDAADGEDTAGENPEVADEDAQAGVAETVFSAEMKKEYGGVVGAKTVKVKVISKSVNVRSGADTNSESLGKVKKDETYTRLGTEGDWSLIDYNGQNGYVKSEFLEVVQ